VISIVVARHESLPSLPCDYLKIDLPLVGHRVGASHAIARLLGKNSQMMTSRGSAGHRFHASPGSPLNLLPVTQGRGPH
jgi:hypothetical protein